MINNKKEICVSISVNVNYKDVKTAQTLGAIDFKLDFKDGKFFVKSRTMNFAAEKAYRASDPRTASTAAWSYTETNTDKSAQSPDKVIDWLKYTTQYSADVSSQILSFSEEQTDIKNVSKIYITNSFVEITAKPGFTFAEQSRKNGDFSVVINKGSDEEYDIAYTAKIVEVNGTEALRISFDKAYPQSEIHKIELNYGAK